MLCVFFIIANFFQSLFQPLEPLQEVEQLMAFNQYWEAYTRLNKIIKEKNKDAEPNLYNLRATCALHMAMPSDCINDCSKILKMKASNEEIRSALTLRAQAHLQLGDFETATKDAKSANDMKTLRSINDVKKLSKSIDNFMNNGQIDESKKYLDRVLRVCPKASKYLMMRSDIAWLEGDHSKYEELTNSVSGEYADDPKMNYRKGVINLCKDKLDDAKKLLKISMKSKKAPKNASVAFSTINNIVAYKKAAESALNKNDQEKAEIAINHTINSTRQFCPSNSPLVQSTNMLQIKFLKLKNDKHHIIDVLDDMIKANPSNLDLILERGDIHLELGDYDAAIFDYNSVQSQNPQNRRAVEGMQKAHEMKKAATHVDHYKILNVSKTATSVEIKAAYRKMVIKWHPDRYSDKEAKKEAEAMMVKINTAYEILSDPKRRNLYDQGIDPDDPMSGAGENPFGDGFDPFDIIKQTMGGQGSPFDFFFNDNDMEGGAQGETFHFGGQNIHIEFNF
ncbi:hypothetical protein M9Y10_013695 [Tritrichomonas musculus]|uniref:J domain-containing protein n=1 Tax=Tritrichomonas musculus TaxID=1915356 RepID=A0ABR2KXI9_9EUKA